MQKHSVINPLQIWAMQASSNNQTNISKFYAIGTDDVEARRTNYENSIFLHFAYQRCQLLVIDLNELKFLPVCWKSNCHNYCAPNKELLCVPHLYQYKAMSLSIERVRSDGTPSPALVKKNSWMFPRTL